MGVVFTLASLAFILLVMMDAFESMVLPRRVTRRYRYTRLYFRLTWKLWRGIGRRLPPGKYRENFLSLFGPLSLLGLFASWCLGLIAGFAALNWSLGTPLGSTGLARDFPPGDFTDYLYLSGGNFFTLSFGDVVPLGTLGRALAVAEGGIGFGFLAVIIGYLPVLYQAFSRREVAISLLDARAGSPPSAAQALVRVAQSHSLATLDPFLAEWERWAGELLESHLSFPVLSYYRSQHDNQSWLAALTTILDTCAFLMAGLKEACPYQAQLTFAMSRHAVVDLALVFFVPPQKPDPDRLSAAQLQRLREDLREVGVEMREGAAFEAHLAQLRGMYEPFVNTLARHFLFALPPVVRDKTVVDNWQTSAWTRRTPGIGVLPVAGEGDDHFV
jgi:hypothetical protein